MRGSEGLYGAGRMRTGARLALYGLGLVLVFGGAFGIAGAVAPAGTATAWVKGTEMNDHDQDHSSASAAPTAPAADAVKGLASASGGYMLSPVSAPATVGAAGELSFRIQDPTGTAVTEYASSHERDLHLIVVRADGSRFRHVHPELDRVSGTWSIPWEWVEAGSYRVFADFTPAGAGASALTLTSTVHVTGQFSTVTPEPTRSDHLDGFTVSVDGELVAGSSSELTISITRDGEPVTVLQPYLGAFGHLVALREGDLAFLHVHAEGDDPRAGELAGPTIRFAAEAPTPGRYLLYLDFKVDGAVHTAAFVLDAAEGATSLGAGRTPHPVGH